MTDFGHYWGSGSGRDGYIMTNNGGLHAQAQVQQRPFEGLRDSLHRPEQRILLPSYAPTAAALGLPPNSPRRLGATLGGGVGGGAQSARPSVAHEALQRAARRDPLRRAQAAHQRRVAHLMHTARGSNGAIGKTVRQQIHAQYAASQGLPYFARTAEDLVPPIPAHPPSRQQLAYLQATGSGGNHTARFPLRPSATQPIGQWDNFGKSYSQTISPRKLRPLGGAGVGSKQQQQQQQQSLPGDQGRSAQVVPASSSVLSSDAVSAAAASVTPGPFQQVLSAEFLHDEAVRRDREAQRQKQASSQACPTAHEDIFPGPLPQQQSNHQQRFLSPAPLPSYHTTLPRGSGGGYLGRGTATERSWGGTTGTRGSNNSSSDEYFNRHRDYNFWPAAGYSALEKQKQRGVLEASQPLLC